MGYSEAILFENLRRAAYKCAKGTDWKASVQTWMFNKNMNSAELQTILMKDEYKIRPYIKFYISSPKPRLIQSTRFRDRVVQRSMCDNGLYDALTKPLIYDNCACLEGKGITFALNRFKTKLIQYYARNKTNKGYVLVLDIHKFFDSVPHNKLKEIVKQYVKDPGFVARVFEIIDSFKDPRSEAEIKADTFGERGVGLGSQISQLLMLLYTTSVDRYISHQLKNKYYVRYMDDMVLIVRDLDEARRVFNNLAQKFAELGLELNPKSHIIQLSQHINFLKVHFTLSNTGRVQLRLKKKILTREVRHIKKLIDMLVAGKLDYEAFIAHVNSWIGSNKLRMTKCQLSWVNSSIRIHLFKRTGNEIYLASKS